MATATMEATLESVRSHSVTRDYHRASEECFPTLTVEVGGTVRKVDMEANRYQASSWNEQTGETTPVWSEWRVFIRDISPLQGVGDVTRGKIRDACVPVVEEWLASDGYKESRSRAFVWMIRNNIREERYNADRCEELLRKHLDELTDDQQELLSAAVDALRGYLAALEAINLEAIT